MSDFVSAEVIPYKLFISNKFSDVVQKKYISPINTSISLTNKCNMKCSFCSCKNVDRNLELPFDNVKQIISILSDLGNQAVTITGGGEPLMYPYINETITTIKNSSMDVGITTNGYLLDRLLFNSFNKLTWCRISVSKETDVAKIFTNDCFISHGSVTDFSFSYVVCADENLDKIKSIIDFAVENNFTHIRFVNDIFNIEKTDFIKVSDYITSFSHEYLGGLEIILQERHKFASGMSPCYHSLLKPYIGSDGYVYPCCGTQYANKDFTYSFDPNMRLGFYTDLEDIVKNQKFFDGSYCYRCYYGNYNIALSNLMRTNVKHGNFV